jgi:CBS domain-containing protein
MVDPASTQQESIHEEGTVKVRDILSVKGTDVFSIAADATLQDVAAKLVEYRVGSLLIFHVDRDGNPGELAGIVTEKDILYACADGKRALHEVKVAHAMSTVLITGTPDDDLEHVMGLMTTRRIRHLPVLSQGRLTGIISIGDVVKAQHDRLALENRCLKDYITG